MMVQRENLMKKNQKQIHRIQSQNKKKVLLLSLKKNHVSVAKKNISQLETHKSIVPIATRLKIKLKNKNLPKLLMSRSTKKKLYSQRLPAHAPHANTNHSAKHHASASLIPLSFLKQKTNGEKKQGHAHGSAKAEDILLFLFKANVN
jgi:hypothetical protein